MALPPSLFWVTWSSLNGAEASTLHPADVDSLKIGVREKLKEQTRAGRAALPVGVQIKDVDSAIVIAFQRNMLLPQYEYNDRFARDAQGKATDRLLACSINLTVNPQTAAAQAYNELIERVQDTNKKFEESAAEAKKARIRDAARPERLTPAYRYDATPEEHELLKAQNVHREPEHRIFLTSRGVDIMRAVRHLFPKNCS